DAARTSAARTWLSAPRADRPPAGRASPSTKARAPRSRPQPRRQQPLGGANEPSTLVHLELGELMQRRQVSRSPVSEVCSRASAAEEAPTPDCRSPTRPADDG